MSQKDILGASEGSEEEEEDGEEESSEYETESGSGSSGSSEEESGSDEDEAEDGDEPVLKYKRFAKDVVSTITESRVDVLVQICCIAVHAKFIALGRTDGSLQLLDHSGVILVDKAFYALHSGPINQIAVDEDGEYIASCSDDRKVIIIGLFSARYNNMSTYDRPVKSVAIHPNFSKSTNHIIVVGTDKLTMVEERRWPLGSKTTDIHGGGGYITTIKWKKNLIAWANEKAVLVYDILIKEIITSISFEEDIQRSVPCSMAWQTPEVLLVGRGHLVKTVTLQEVQEGLMRETSSFDPSVYRMKKRMAITAQNSFQEFLVCGVVPIKVESAWKLAVLGYSGNIDQESAVEKGEVPPPHLMVVSPGQYIPDTKTFETPENDTFDKLLPKGHQYCKCQEYKLDYIENEGRLYILTPVDMILAERRGHEDHVDWLISRKKDYEAAMKYVENPEIARQMAPGRLKEIGVHYIYYLMRSQKFHEAARKCPDVLGDDEREKKRWEDIVFNFYESKKLNEIRPFIPLVSPKLSAFVYELVLNHFLQEDHDMLYNLIREWPKTLYSTQTIINAVDLKLKHDPKNSGLLKVKACLHEDLDQYDLALKIYLQQGHTEVFELIHARKLYNALLENLIPLLEVNIQKAVKLLVDCKEDVPPKRVVSELESLGREEYLHKYLDCMFEQNPKSGGEFHERQVELYAKYDSDKLLLFLKQCNDIPLQKALEVCQTYQRWEETAYLLARMGNPKAALQHIISKVQNVNKAIEFATDEDDAELWEVLINLSIDKPEFITGLLENVGTHIDPTRLIKEIPDGMQIDHLGSSLVKLMQDFRIQVNLRDGCRKILVKDSHVLMEKLVKLQQKAVFVDDESTCRTCGGEVVGLDDKAEYMVFFCGHTYHRRCVPTRNGMMLCRLCYAGATNAKRKGRLP